MSADYYERWSRGDKTIRQRACKRCGGYGSLMDSGTPPSPFDLDFHPSLYACGCDEGSVYVSVETDRDETGSER